VRPARGDRSREQGFRGRLEGGTSRDRRPTAVLGGGPRGGNGPGGQGHHEVFISLPGGEREGRRGGIGGKGAAGDDFGPPKSAVPSGGSTAGRGPSFAHEREAFCSLEPLGLGPVFAFSPFSLDGERGGRHGGLLDRGAGRGFTWGADGGIPECSGKTGTTRVGDGSPPREIS